MASKYTKLFFTDGCDELCRDPTNVNYAHKVEQRQRATRNASEILNLGGTVFLRFPEGVLMRDENSRYRAGDQMVDLLKMIGFEKDDQTKHNKVIIVAPTVNDESPDHIAVAEVLNYFLEYQEVLVKSVYRYQTWPSNEPRLQPNCVFISTVEAWKAKEDAVKAHNMVDHFKEVIMATGDYFWNIHIPDILKLFTKKGPCNCEFFEMITDYSRLVVK